MDFAALSPSASRRLYLNFYVKVGSSGTPYFFYLPLYYNSDISITLVLLGFNVNFVLPNFILCRRGREVWTIKNKRQENASGGEGRHK